MAHQDQLYLHALLQLSLLALLLHSLFTFTGHLTGSLPLKLWSWGYFVGSLFFFFLLVCLPVCWAGFFM